MAEKLIFNTKGGLIDDPVNDVEGEVPVTTVEPFLEAQRLRPTPRAPAE